MCFTGLQLQAQIDQHQSDIDILSDTVSESSVDIDAPPSSSVENSYTHSSGSRTTDPVNSSDSSSSQSSPPPSVDFQLPKLVRQRRVYFVSLVFLSSPHTAYLCHIGLQNYCLF